MSTNRKVCFVTIGATASFATLIRAVLEPKFFAALKTHGYTDLIVQYGADGEALYLDRLKESGGDAAGLRVEGFGLDQRGLGGWMRLAKTGDDGGNSGQRKRVEGVTGVEGVIVSHAGSGTILAALRLSVPLIVVPNSELLDNHQLELAEALAEQEYVIHGLLENLPQALADTEKLRVRKTQWPPVNSGVHRKAAKGLAGVMDEEMGFLD